MYSYEQQRMLVQAETHERLRRRVGARRSVTVHERVGSAAIATGEALQRMGRRLRDAGAGTPAPAPGECH